MSSVKNLWSTHLGRAVIVALLVALALSVVRVAGFRPAGALDVFFTWLLDETGLGEPLDSSSALVFITVIGLLETLFALLVGAIVGWICRLSGFSVTTTGWVSGVFVAALQLPVNLVAMPLP